MSEEKNVPNIRFKGFTDPWEQRKLGKVGKTFTGLSGKTKEDFGHGDAKFVTYMNVFNNPVSDLEMTDSIEVDAKQNSVEYGDVFFTTSSETPEEVGMSSVWLGNKENVYLNSFSFGYHPDKIFAPYYLAFMLRSPAIRRNFMFLAQGISRYNISKTKVMDMEVPVPKFEEQKQIGDCFKQLDTTIALHQQKVTQLKELKKLLMQKIFDQEWRFKGFTDPWEQRKFSELYKKNVEQNDQLFSREKTISISSMSYNPSGNGAIDITKYKVLRTGDIAFEGHNNAKFSFGRFVLNDLGDGIMSPRFKSLRPLKDLPIQFWKYYIHYEPIMKNILVRSTKKGTMMNELVLNDFFKQPIRVPVKNEQNTIGQLLSHLSSTIALHQQKVDELKELKKYLMQNLFV